MIEGRRIPSDISHGVRRAFLVCALEPFPRFVIVLREAVEAVHMVQAHAVHDLRRTSPNGAILLRLILVDGGRRP